MATLKYKFLLLKGLLNGEKAFREPDYVSVDVTKRCNIRYVGCFFYCIQDRQRRKGCQGQKDLSLEIVDKMCQKLPFSNVVFTSPIFRFLFFFESLLLIWRRDP